jgi:LPS O-antigen subunit length determinant protein (WzzB/FepE family)
MATQAAAVDLLMNKGEFESQVALAIAEAVAIIMTEAQVVTVPVLDSRVAALDHKTDLVESRLGKKIDLVESRLEKKIELVRVNLESKITELDGKIEGLRTELEGKIELTRAQLENKIDIAVARLEKAIAVTSATMKAELATTKAELVRWVFVATVGSVFLQGMTSAIVNGFMRH